MTKLSSRLPDSNGLSWIADQLVAAPSQRHVVVGAVDCQKVSTDYERSTVEPTARLRTVEVVTGPDVALLETVLRRAIDRRNGATMLPLHVEDELADIFRVDPEDLASDLADSTDDLTTAQAKDLADALDRPLRREVADAIDVLRGSPQWVRLGRARRVLQLALQHLVRVDLELLRDESTGDLIDPRTGEVITSPETLTSADLDALLTPTDDTGTPADDDEPTDDEDGDDDAPDGPA